MRSSIISCFFDDGMVELIWRHQTYQTSQNAPNQLTIPLNETLEGVLPNEIRHKELHVTGAILPIGLENEGKSPKILVGFLIFFENYSEMLFR